MGSGLGVTAKPYAGFQKPGLLFYVCALYFIKGDDYLGPPVASCCLASKQERVEVTQRQIKVDQICDAVFFVIGKNGPVSLGLHVETYPGQMDLVQASTNQIFLPK